MKNSFMNIKRSIAVILMLCILLGIAGTCVYAVAVEETIPVAKETTQELVPMMVQRCAHVHTDSCYTETTAIRRCYVDYYYGNQPQCSAGYSNCYGDRHTYTETWYVLTCVN